MKLDHISVQERDKSSNVFGQGKFYLNDRLRTATYLGQLSSSASMFISEWSECSKTYLQNDQISSISFFLEICALQVLNYFLKARNFVHNLQIGCRSGDKTSKLKQIIFTAKSKLELNLPQK